MSVSYGLHIALVIGCISLFAWGCDGGDTDHSGATRRAPRALPSGYRVTEVVNGATLSGSVVWMGARPDVVMTRVLQHASVCGAERALPALRIGPHGGVADAVVYLDGITEGRALPEGPFEVRFSGCDVSPTVLAMPVGATLTIVDDEDLLHNVHLAWVHLGSVQPSSATGGATWLDLGLPSRGMRASATAEHTGVASIVDDAGHPWILGWVHVLDHPYVQVTTEDGRFRLTGIPPGQYTLRVWHQGVRRSGGTESESGSSPGERPRMSAPLVLARPVAVTAGTDTTVDFQLDLSTVEAAGD
ncbi:MAG: carboxypeptidase-like regulatory domain-containing protein [Sandaracinus sp.]